MLMIIHRCLNVQPTAHRSPKKTIEIYQNVCYRSIKYFCLHAVFDVSSSNSFFLSSSDAKLLIVCSLKIFLFVLNMHVDIRFMCFNTYLFFLPIKKWFVKMISTKKKPHVICLFAFYCIYYIHIFVLYYYFFIYFSCHVRQKHTPLTYVRRKSWVFMCIWFDLILFDCMFFENECV